jgi:ribose transport system permease protein
LKRLVQQYAALIALIVLFVFNVFWLKGDFYGAENLRNILTQNASKGMIAVGMTIVIIAGGIDLSVGSMVGLLGVLSLLCRVASPWQQVSRSWAEGFLD